MVTPLRELLLKRLHRWAHEAHHQGLVARAYVFGSLVTEDGAQFVPSQSDVDLLAVYPPSASDAVTRVAILDRLRDLIHALELDLMPLLRWQNASKPVVSLSVVTDLEQRFGVHKGKSPDIYTASLFLDLLGTNAPGPLSRMPGPPYTNYSALTPALELAQEFRNKYVSISANTTRALSEWDETDPLPKLLMRTTAQFDYFRQPRRETARFDPNEGARVIENLVVAGEEHHQEFTALRHVVTARRNGRGIRRALTPHECRRPLESAVF